MAGTLAARWPGLGLTLALEIEGHRGADEILQARLIDQVHVHDHNPLRQPSTSSTRATPWSITREGVAERARSDGGRPERASRRATQSAAGPRITESGPREAGSDKRRRWRSQDG